MDKIKGPKHDQVLGANKQNTNTNIISLGTEESKMKNRVIEELGYKPEEEGYKKAYEYAKHKLEWQSKHFNKTFNKEYTAIVIAETYEQQIRMDHINTVSLGRI